MQHSYAALLLSAFVSLLDATAQIRNCNGVLTNRDCRSGPVVLEEKPYEKPSPADLQRRKREILLSSLETLGARIRSKHGVDIDTSVVRAICETGSLKECRQAVLDKEKAAQKLADRRAKDRKRDEAKQEELEDSPAGEASSTVVVIENEDDGAWEWRDPYTRVRRPRRPGNPHYHPPSGRYPPGRAPHPPAGYDVPFRPQRNPPLLGPGSDLVRPNRNPEAGETSGGRGAPLSFGR